MINFNQDFVTISTKERNLLYQSNGKTKFVETASNVAISAMSI